MLSWQDDSSETEMNRGPHLKEQAKNRDFAQGANRHSTNEYTGYTEVFSMQIMNVLIQLSTHR